MNENSGTVPSPAPNAAASAAAADIDMSFLQQFSCMGTTDHDELVHQLQKVIGGPLNNATAKFFLEMNNWNLQGAVGSYFDYHAGLRLPSMRQISAGLGVAVTLPPQVQYTHSWHVQNNGEDRWPVGCYLRCTAPFAPPAPPNVPVQPLGAGEMAILTVPLSSPAVGGVFKTQWQLCTSNGSIFGEILWAIVQVQAPSTIDEEAQLMDAGGNGLVEQQQQQQQLTTTSLMPISGAEANHQLVLPQPQPQPQTSPEDSEMC